MLGSVEAEASIATTVVVWVGVVGRKQHCLNLTNPRHASVNDVTVGLFQWRMMQKSLIRRITKVSVGGLNFPAHV